MNLRSRALGGLLLLGVGIGLSSGILNQFSVQSTVQEKTRTTANLESPAPAIAKISGDRTLPLAAIYQQVNPAVVTIYGAHNLGSGMILKAKGLVLTNRHVVQDASQVGVKTADGKTYAGDVIDLDLRYDLALIQLKNVAGDLPIIPLANQPESAAGETVYAIGSPNGKAGTLTTGTFLRVTQQGSLQISSGLLNPGNSGGPLLNRRGEVIGVNKGLLPDQSGLATSVVAIHALLERRDRLDRKWQKAEGTGQRAEDQSIFRVGGDR